MLTRPKREFPSFVAHANTRSLRTRFEFGTISGRVLCRQSHGRGTRGPRERGTKVREGKWHLPKARVADGGAEVQEITEKTSASEEPNCNVQPEPSRLFVPVNPTAIPRPGSAGLHRDRAPHGENYPNNHEDVGPTEEYMQGGVLREQCQHLLLASQSNFQPLSQQRAQSAPSSDP